MAVLESIEKYFQYGNPLDAIIVIGSLGRTEEGLNQLLQQKEESEGDMNLLSLMLGYIHQGVETKICVLSAFTEMFEKRYHF